MQLFRRLTNIIFILIIVTLSANGQYSAIKQYNVQWNSQSKNSSESMPCGGGDVGVNVWVENGDLLLYLAKSGSFDENNAMLKLGRIRVKFPEPISQQQFSQTLNLVTGAVDIRTQLGNLSIWVDVFNPNIYIDLKNNKALKTEIIYESWRFEDRLHTNVLENRGNSFKWLKVPVKTYQDSMVQQNDFFIFSHNNHTNGLNVFDYTVNKQGLDSIKHLLYNPIKNNRSGGVINIKDYLFTHISTGKYMDSDYKAWHYLQKKASKNHSIQISLAIAQNDDYSSWQQEAIGTLQKGIQQQKQAQKNSLKWWQDFWNRSYVHTYDTNSYISRNYTLFRYMLACNAYGQWPTKFNGGLFTFDPVFVKKEYPFTPDFRLWGGGTMTAQNQRLVYFPMFKNGDFDFLKSQFNFYTNSRKNAELRSKFYWNVNGASFSEQLENFGLPNVAEFNSKRPEGYDKGVDYNAWLEYQWETVLEFCKMMLDMHYYNREDIGQYIPFIESCLRFFDEYYRQKTRLSGIKELDENGHYVLYPSSAAETFKMAYNSVTLIAGLDVVVNDLLNLPQQFYDTTRYKNWQKIKQQIPPIPFRQFKGKTLIAPALVWSRVNNTETPQLYPVYPWGQFGVGKPGIDTAINTYLTDTFALKFRSHVGWKQDNIFAARLGLTKEAFHYTSLKFKDGPHRFPAFWGPGFDWTPDHNWGGSAMIGLQEMLLQVVGDKFYLLPAWPKDADVSFKLHAPNQTTVEVEYKNGVFKTINILPAVDKSRIVLPD
ncbi:DUF5703 domain-containing protein [Polluticaenibacter yanchengensis]|uniref:DUF5703 domain-containing protein n=1 Tax=Polluticaenibacter yanchengensis TaxID=3014562 RepID=A0ABT4UHZ0_9BACT|nr:DUF5703 domain-containing protein [Chitinophagaceae bacterium LY-5]